LRTTPSSYPDFYNLSSSGDTSAHILARIESGIIGFAQPGNEPCAVVIAVGTNDAWMLGGQPHVELADYRNNLNQILAVACQHTDRLLVVGLPPVDEDETNPWLLSTDDLRMTNDRLREYDDAARTLCAEQDIPFTSVMEKFLRAMQDEKLLADGVHPNERGHELIAEIVRPEIAKLVK